AAVGPGAVAQPEDVAEPVLGNDPAIRQPGNHAPLRVERDEAGISRRADVLRAGRKPQPLGEQLLWRVDESELDGAVVAPAARQRECGQQSNQEPVPRHGPALDHVRSRLNPLSSEGTRSLAGQILRRRSPGSCEAGTAW